MGCFQKGKVLHIALPEESVLKAHTDFVRQDEEQLMLVRQYILNKHLGQIVTAHCLSDNYVRVDDMVYTHDILFYGEIVSIPQTKEVPCD
jgi:hypothetical protein